jgi:hypothetical protein
MPIELAGIQLNRIHQIETLEQGNFIYHRVPGSQGNITQNIGRDSVCLKLQGIFYGPKAQENLESLRQVYQKRKAVDFLADIVGQSYFSQVILDRFEVIQSSRDPEQFSYSLTITEHVPPPSPAPSTAAVNTAIKADAANFLTIATLPDVLKMGSLPEVSNPIEPLGSALAPIQDATKNLDTATAGLKALFNF